ncbi:Ger(x)C family spore germination protein [Paenibacillus glycinis]|uniref:Ger(X)C family spore germination protein n=1 Tax=Paenibacillus glycinis TaxID=2697035 RepID=A0ABW9XYX1_9BACL|nr:Ger(x)C family spore germination protein [Paenibacillus glycinis]NBD27928.1 Ger(x)C family spore germination protein [Paenibacillus glycinis]
MIRLALAVVVVIVLTLSASGCSDFVEPNQLAFVMASGLDHAENGMIEISHQIVIPSQLKKGSPGKSDSYFVMSAKGKDIFDAQQKIQRKLSRRMLTSHRILLLVGEEFMKHNQVSVMFDKLGRDPANNLRDAIVMVRGGSAKDILMLTHPMEYLSSVAAGKELQINGMKSFSSRKLVIDSLAEGSRPIIPFFQIEKIELSRAKKSPVAVLSGFAVLDKQLKVKGYLSDAEGAKALWMIGRGSSDGITIPWKDGNGALSFRMTHMNRRIHVLRGQDPKRVELTVAAQVYLLENTASLDMSEVDTMVMAQHYLNDYVQKDLQGTFDKMQRWGPDVFGIGEYLHRKDPAWWRSQKNDWDENFKKLDVTVKAKIQLRSSGIIGDQLK